MPLDIEARQVRAIAAHVSDEKLVVGLDDGRTISTPLAWYPRLVHATEQERNNFRMVGRGSGIHWPDLDEDVSIEAMLLGRPSGEGPESLKWWLQARRARPHPDDAPGA